MAGSDDLHDEIDDILTELLPSQSEEAEEPADHTDPSPEFTELQRSLTYSNQHPEAYILEAGKSEIKNLCDTIEEAESDQGTAEQLFEQYLERSEAEFVVEPYAAAALYCACKINGSGVTPTQFASASYDFIEQKHLFRRAKRIMTVLDLKVEAFFDPTQYVDTFSEALDVLSLFGNKRTN